MMKKDNKVNEKPYSALLLLKDFILIEAIVMYLVLVIGDFISAVSELPTVLTRYIPVAVATIVTTFFVIKSKSKKCKKSEEKEVKKYILIAPVILAVIILLYGLYSVESNLREIDTGTLRLLFSEEYVEQFIQQAANSARVSWFITATTYLIAAEAVVLIKRKKIGMLLKEDLEAEPMMMGQSEFVNMQNNFEMPEKNNEAINNIKWDL